jgi:hypothetical protein
MRAVVLALASLFWACGTPEHSPTMKPGEDCLRCHGAGSELHWYAAGTVYLDKQTKAGDGVQGIEVVLTDAHGRTISLETNGAGNFYTAEALAFPAKAEVRRKGKTLAMPIEVPEGGCNSCHTAGDTGRIVGP